MIRRHCWHGLMGFVWAAIPALLSGAEPFTLTRILDDLDTVESMAAWTAKSGGGVACTARHVATVPGSQGGVLAAQISTPSTAGDGPKWFTVTRVPREPIELGDGDGIAIRLAVEQPGRWWLAAHVEAAGKGHSKAFEPIEFSSAFETRLVPFDQFVGEAGEAIDPTSITAVGLVGSGSPDNVLYIDSIAIYKVETMQYPVTFHTQHPDLNLFEPGQTVEFTFTIESGVPPATPGLEYDVVDYFDATVATGHVTLDGEQRTFSARFDPPSPGYYDVRAYWLTADGKRLTGESCIRTSGSVPQGRGTFAVMPRTLAENKERMARLGERAFFGLHGDHSVGGGPLLSDYIGAAWGISDSSRWSWDEPTQRPDRKDGIAPWARDAMGKATSRAPKLCLNNLGISHDMPAWAKSDTPDKAPGFAAWEDFEAYFRDYVQLRKLWYPHMRNRLYDVGWETNLNKPLTGIHKPVYHPADVMELYRRAKRVLDVEDPDGCLVGPCVSSYVSDYDWMEPLFDAGLMDILDGFNCHGYHTPPPERSGLVEKTRVLLARLADLTPGRDIPLICSELGFRSQYGATDRHKEHACWHVRVAAILKGEGFDAYMPFYSYDYPGDNSTYGICYNLDPDLNWGPAAGLSPKAATPALAVCIDQLEGTRPVSDLRVFGHDVWGYVFARDDRPLLCLWTVENEHTMQLPAGAVEAVSVIDIMGRSRTLPVTAGLADLRLSPAPVYVQGVEPGLYMDTRPMQARTLADVFAGQSATVEVSDYARLASATPIGPVEASVAGDTTITIRVPDTTVPGAFPVQLAGTAADGTEKQSVAWVVVPESLEVLGVGPILLETRPGARLDVRNRGALDEMLQVTVRLHGTVRNLPGISIPGASTVGIEIPLAELGEAVDPTQQIPLRLELRGEHMADSVLQRRLCFLSARHRNPQPTETGFPHRATWSAVGSSGRTDTAEAQFEWDERALYIDVRVADDVFHQTQSDGTVWREDSVQVAFDTHPERDTLYEPLASVFTKKVTQISVAKTPAGTQVWRDRTHHEGELPTGRIEGDIAATVERDEAAQTTTYRLSVPWPQIGLERPRAGEPLGIAVLVNDSDGPGTPRRGLELFSGIMNDKSHTLYGSILLETDPVQP